MKGKWNGKREKEVEKEINEKWNQKWKGYTSNLVEKTSAKRSDARVMAANEKHGAPKIPDAAWR